MTVHEILQKQSILDSVFTFMPLIGTDTMSNNVMGEVTLQAVEDGKEPAGHQVEAGKSQYFITKYCALIFFCHIFRYERP